MNLSIKVSLKSDDKVWKRMAKNLSRGGNKASAIGWWNSIHPTGIPVAQVAQLNEEGHENGAGSAYPGTITPARPFIRLGFLPKVEKEGKTLSEKSLIEIYINLLNGVI